MMEKGIGDLYIYRNARDMTVQSIELENASARSRRSLGYQLAHACIMLLGTERQDQPC